MSVIREDRTNWSVLEKRKHFKEHTQAYVLPAARGSRDPRLQLVLGHYASPIDFSANSMSEIFILTFPSISPFVPRTYHLALLFFFNVLVTTLLLSLR